MAARTEREPVKIDPKFGLPIHSGLACKRSLNQSARPEELERSQSTSFRGNTSSTGSEARNSKAVFEGLARYADTI
jgi:hypothetical protein